MDKKRVGKCIAEQRKGRGLKQAQLAEMLNVSNKTISRWERGVNLPDYDQLLALCDLFTVDVRELMTGNLLPCREKPIKNDAALEE